MTERETLKLALEALKHTHPSALTSFYTIGDRDKAIKAIQEHLAQPEYQSTADKSQLEKIPAKGTLLAQPEQEPFCWAQCTSAGLYVSNEPDEYYTMPLYTTPPQRKPLTDEEIKAVCAETWSYDPYVIARAIEAAHGIKENT